MGCAVCIVYSIVLHVNEFISLSVMCSFIKQNYQFLKRCVESSPVTPMQQEWFQNILDLIPTHLKSDLTREVLQELFEETRDNFDESMKKSSGEELKIF